MSYFETKCLFLAYALNWKPAKPEEVVMKQLVLVLGLVAACGGCSRQAGFGGVDFSSLDGDITYHSYEKVTVDGGTSDAFEYISIDMKQNQDFALKQYASPDGSTGKSCEILGTWEYPDPTDENGSILRVHVTSVNGGAVTETKDYDLRVVSYDTLRLKLDPGSQVLDLTNKVITTDYPELSGVNLSSFTAETFCN